MSNYTVFMCKNENCENLIEMHPWDASLCVACNSCELNWCKSCNQIPYHDNMSCIEFEASHENSEIGKFLKEKTERGDIKFCPRCRVPTEKIRNENGKFVACNKITCSQCTTKWCWLCSEHDIDYDHYSIKNETPCSKKLWEGVEV